MICHCVPILAYIIYGYFQTLDGLTRLNFHGFINLSTDVAFTFYVINSNKVLVSVDSLGHNECCTEKLDVVTKSP